MEFLLENKKLKIDVKRTNVKNLNLHIYSNSKIKMSVPISVSDEYIFDFLHRKQSWIKTKINLFESAKKYSSVSKKIENGYSVKLLGRQYEIVCKKSKKNNVYILDNKLIILYRENTSATKLYTKYYNDVSSTFISQLLTELFPILKKYGFVCPFLKIRKMDSRWGSYSKRNNTVYINKDLYQAPVECIKYVVMHELTHILYPNHDEKFYNFLSLYIPNWKDCKTKLDYEFVREL